VREARTLNQPSPLTAYTNVERELSLINLSLRQQLVGFDNCCKSLKSIVAQLRIIASYFENKLREYNKNVEVITTLVTDQEEELWWFIPWCPICVATVAALCAIFVGAPTFAFCVSVCQILPFPLNLIRGAACAGLIALSCLAGACGICVYVGLCKPREC